MNPNEQSSCSGKPKRSGKEAFISEKERRDSYNREKPVCEYTITELAYLFEHIEFKIENLKTHERSGPFFIKIKPLEIVPSGDLDDFTVEGLLAAIEHIEWTVSDKKDSFGDVMHLLTGNKAGR
jgi:hypothetical protein